MAWPEVVVLNVSGAALVHSSGLLWYQHTPALCARGSTEVLLNRKGKRTDEPVQKRIWFARNAAKRSEAEAGNEESKNGKLEKKQVANEVDTNV